ncbi:MAG: transcriptional repressor [Deltaproteobacteria bacterium]|nr:transcriptional repressor [Deltaproteobacteria bacterium]
MPTTSAILKDHGIRPTPQRRVVLEYVRASDQHPTAEDIYAHVHRRRASVSRATVYNTLHLLVDHGLVRRLVLAGGTVAFDARVHPHHHFVDERTGEVQDIPFEALRIEGVEALSAFDVEHVQVVVYGRKKSDKGG